MIGFINMYRRYVKQYIFFWTILGSKSMLNAWTCLVFCQPISLRICTRSVSVQICAIICNALTLCASHLCQHSNNGIVRHERDSRLGGHASQSRYRSLVECTPTLVVPHLPCTIPATAVPVTVETLHAGFDNVHWRIGVRRNDAGENAEYSDDQCGRFVAGRRLIRVELFAGFDDAKTNRLIAALLQDRCG